MCGCDNNILKSKCKKDMWFIFCLWTFPSLLEDSFSYSVSQSLAKDTKEFEGPMRFCPSCLSLKTPLHHTVSLQKESPTFYSHLSFFLRKHILLCIKALAQVRNMLILQFYAISFKESQININVFICITLPFVGH